MARYIDADKFIERLKASPAFPNMGMDGYFLLDVVENLLKKFPTADVAPKSEVAREIFEEIEKWIDSTLSIIQKILNAKGGRSNGKTVLISKYDMLIESKKFIAELKKKYTEEKK